MQSQNSANITELQRLITTYDQSDTLNIFGKNVFVTNPNNIIQNTVDPCFNINNTGCNNNHNNHNNSDTVIDYVLMIEDLYSSSGVTLTNFGAYVFTGETSASESETLLFDNLSDYYIAYNGLFNPPNIANLNNFNNVKNSLLEFICTIIESYNVDTIKPEFPNLNNESTIGYNTFLCILQNIKRILCEKSCETSCDECNCKTRCENNIISDIITINTLFVNIGDTPTDFETNGGTSIVTNMPFNIGSSQLDNILNINITSSNTNIRLLSYLSNYYHAYLFTLICPCNQNFIDNLYNISGDLRDFLLTLIPYGSNYTTLSELLTTAFVAGSEIRNFDIYGDPTGWFIAFENVLTHMIYTLNDCPLITKCNCMKQSCESDIIATLFTLSSDIINSINIAGSDTWEGISGPLMFPYDPSVQPSITSSFVVNNVDINIELNFINLGVGTDCGVTAAAYADQWLPDITIIQTPIIPNVVSCTTETFIPLGTQSLTLYNDFIDYKTALCNNYLESKNALKEVITLMNPYFCIKDECGTSSLFDLLGTVVKHDMNLLCCLTTNCMSNLCCRPNSIAQFIIEFLKIIELEIKCYDDNCNNCNDDASCTISCNTTNTTNTSSSFNQNTLVCLPDIESIIDTVLETTSKTNNKMAMTLLFKNLIVPLQQQYCCLAADLENTQEELCKINNEFNKSKKKLSHLLKENCELKKEICELENNDIGIKDTMNSVVKHVSETDYDLTLLSREINICCGKKNCKCNN